MRKIISVFFLHTFLFTICLHSSFSLEITEDKSYYYVKNIKLESLITTEIPNVKQYIFNQVKRYAFDEVAKKIGKTNAVPSDENIDASISGYKIIDEYYDSDYFSVIANFTFNKSVLKDIAEGSNETDVSDKENEIPVNAIVVLEEVGDVIDEYNVLKKWLIKNKIQYVPYKITYKQVQVKVFNIAENRFYDNLRKLNINGSMYVEE